MTTEFCKEDGTGITKMEQNRRHGLEVLQYLKNIWTMVELDLLSMGSVGCLLEFLLQVLEMIDWKIKYDFYVWQYLYTVIINNVLI